ncbi:MAG: hypothetical protein IJ106_00560 [Parasporobacterium sp.]|nr:hypothetical protein [Parasporobacterium sp.]
MANIDFTDSIYDAQQGSQSAIQFIYDNTIQLFNKEANAFMRNKNEADRAIRDAYVFIFDHLDSLEDTSKFLLWANEVCKNTCISRLSEAGVFNERVPAEAINLGEISPASDYDPQINMNANMSPDYIQECLEAVLSSLPDNQRACAVLWGEGYPINSISRKLGISPVAVNYTLAYTLGNITNSINMLSANGLPLFGMEPIPYFLWLLISYYQFYQPKEAAPGSASSFSNILRTLMPDEASVYSGGYETEEPEPLDDRVQHVTGVEENDSVPVGFDPDDLDLEDFITGGPEKEEEPAEEPLTVPAMDIISPHKEEFRETLKSEEQAPESGAEADRESSGEEEENAAGVIAGESAAAAAGLAEGETVALETVEGTASEEGTSEAAAAVAEGGAAAGEAVQTEEGGKKKHTGLLITLFIILILLILIAVALLFFRDKVNEILGTNLFGTTEVATEPEPETTTEEPTTPEPETETTTEEPTTPEPETTTEEPTTEEVLGPEYNVQIYADGYALAMRSDTTDDAERLLYIPADEEVHIDETRNGWGHTTYDGQDGWIWLEYTKVAGNALVEQPETLLEVPEEYTIGYTEFGNELRTGPGTYYSTFGPIPEGTAIQIEAYYYDSYSNAVWAYTSYEGHHGWVFLYYYDGGYEEY